MAKASSSGTDLVPIGTDYPVLNPESGSSLEAVMENLGDDGIQPFDLDRVGIPAGGGSTWQVPSLEGMEDVRELEGIIVVWRAPRVYWEHDVQDGEPQPPDCSSPDGKYGEGKFAPGSNANPTGACAACPMNEWASAGDGGRGKACKEQRSLYMVRPNSVLPVVVNLPPTSIQPVRKYFQRLAAEGKPYYSVITKLTLEPQSRGAFRWSTATPKLGGSLDENGTKAAKAYGEQLGSQLPKSSPEVRPQERSADPADTFDGDVI